MLTQSRSVHSRSVAVPPHSPCPSPCPRRPMWSFFGKGSLLRNEPQCTLLVFFNIYIADSETTRKRRQARTRWTLHTTAAVFAEWTPPPAQPQPVAPCPRRALQLPVPCRRHASGSARLPCVAPGGGRRRARDVAAVRQGSCLDMPGVPGGGQQRFRRF